MNKKEKKSIYINLKSDFGFKRCFGDEKRLKAFLNVILSDDYGRIEDVKIETPELTKELPHQRGVTFDLRCRLANGDSVIIEMQNYTQKYYKTRTSYYLCTLLDKEIPKGMAWSNMKEDIPRIIGVFLMGSKMDDLNKTITRTSECDLDSGEEFWNRMRKYYISLPHFNINYEHLTLKDAWIEVIKNLENMENIDPRVYEIADESLLELIEKAKVSALTADEYAEYERSMKEIADAGAAEAYGYDRGFEKGRIEEARRTAKEMKSRGIDPQIIEQITHVAMQEIESL